MAAPTRGRQHGAYVNDRGVSYDMLTTDHAFNQGSAGWALSDAGSTRSPRRFKPRRVYGLSPTSGRRGSAIVATLTADLWTGTAATFDVLGDDGVSDTMNVIGQSGEKISRAPAHA